VISVGHTKLLGGGVGGWCWGDEGGGEGVHEPRAPKAHTLRNNPSDNNPKDEAVTLT